MKRNVNVISRHFDLLELSRTGDKNQTRLNTNDNVLSVLDDPILRTRIHVITEKKNSLWYSLYCPDSLIPPDLGRPWSSVKSNERHRFIY